MAKKEAQTDIWVHELLKSAQITLSYQGSDIPELDKALKTASKAGTGKVGKPEFIGVVKDFVLVIENKAETSQHASRAKDGILLEDTVSKQSYALNGALHYARHIIQHTSYRKVFAIGVSGDEKRHLITPVFIDDSLYSRELSDVETFVSSMKLILITTTTMRCLRKRVRKKRPPRRFSEMLRPYMICCGRAD